MVLHDVQKGTISKSDVISQLMELKPVQAVVAQEDYNHQEGNHIHVFYRFNTEKTFNTQLKYWVKFWTSGRVQCDVMRGTMSQSCKYLIAGQTKDKFTDVQPFFYPSQEIAKTPEEAYASWANELLDWCINPDRQGDRDRYYAKQKEMDANFRLNFIKSSLVAKDNFENN